VCAHAVRVSLLSVSGVASVEVSLEKGLANVKMKAGNTATLKQLQEAITKNGFTMKQSHVVAAGKVIEEGGAIKFRISGSSDVLSLVPETSSVAAPSGKSAGTFVVEGTIPESAKGKSADTIRYRTLTEEK
jgi:copper chaperone CopZ